MRRLLKKLLPSVTVALTVISFSLPVPARAQTYPIDCAILLCLSGGWPASVPCTRARAEFIRRITPWPVEPPLQIWRCPMGASFEAAPPSNSKQSIFDAFFQNGSARPRQSFTARDAVDPIPLSWRSPDANVSLVPADLALRRAQDRADIDISGPEFNFVRSIRVFHVRLASQYQTGKDGSCERTARVVSGSYGVQGAFFWKNSYLGALPEFHEGLHQWGEDCPRINHRSVFVDWRDYEGNYGFEQINY